MQIIFEDRQLQAIGLVDCTISNINIFQVLFCKYSWPQNPQKFLSLKVSGPAVYSYVALNAYLKGLNEVCWLYNNYMNHTV